MNERMIIRKLEEELRESEHTIHVLMNTISEKDCQISDLTKSLRIMAETIEEMKSYIEDISECEGECFCDCCGECYGDNCDCDCDECECGCDCEDDCCECPEEAPCGRAEDERCCLFCEKHTEDDAEAEPVAQPIDNKEKLEGEKEFFDFIGRLIAELERNPNLSDFEKHGFEVKINRIK